MTLIKDYIVQRLNHETKRWVKITNTESHTWALARSRAIRHRNFTGQKSRVYNSATKEFWNLTD